MTTQASRMVRRMMAERTAPLMIALLLCCLVLAVRSPSYFSVDNLRVLGLNVAVTAIASVGAAYLIISGKVDLSIGSNFALSAFVAATISTMAPVWVAWVGGIVAGSLVGWANGYLVWRIKVSPIIVTLGSLALLRGVLLVVSNGRGVAGVPDSFTLLGRGEFFGVPVQIVIVIALMAIAGIFLGRTNVGLHIFALGGNEEASEVVGINVRRMILALFAFSGAMVGLAGVVTASRFGTASSQFGLGFELDVLTAVILGGVAFNGGEGSIRGVILAVVFLGVVNSGLVSLGVSAYYVSVVQGAALIASVVIEQLTAERREKYRKSVALAEYAEELRVLHAAEPTR